MHCAMGWRRLGLVGLLATHAAALSTPQSLLVGLGRVAEAHPFVFGSSLTCIAGSARKPAADMIHSGTVTSDQCAL